MTGFCQATERRKPGLYLPGQYSAIEAAVSRDRRRVQHGFSYPFHRSKPIHDGNPFDSGQLFGSVDSVQSQVIAIGDIRHHGGIAQIESQTFPQEIPPRAVSSAAASSHGRIRKNCAGGFFGPLQSPVSRRRSFRYTPSVQVMPTRLPMQRRMWAIRRVVVVLPFVPVTAAIGIRPSLPWRPNIVPTIASPTGRPLPDDGSRCIRRPGAALISTMMPPCCSSGRLMSWQTTSTPAISRPTIRTPSADNSRGFACFGMDQVGDVGGRATGAQVGISANQHDLARGRNRIRSQTLLRKHAFGNFVQTKLAERRGMVFSTPRILVGFFNQLRHRVTPVTDHLRRLAPRGGHQFVTDHQQTIIRAMRELFADDLVAFFDGSRVGRKNLFTCVQVAGHSAALISVLWLDDDRNADFLSGLPRVVGTGHRSTLRNRNADSVEQLFRQFLVLNDRFGHGRRPIRFGGEDPMLFATVSKLNQTAII